MASWNSLAIISHFSRTMAAPRGARLLWLHPVALTRCSVPRGQPAADLGPSHGCRARWREALALDEDGGPCVQPFV